MATELNIEKLREELIEIYELFLENKHNTVNLNHAGIVYQAYSGAQMFLSDTLNQAVWFLGDLIQDELPGENRDEKREVEEMLESLRKDKLKTPTLKK